MQYVFLGPQGGGKGTQADVLALRLGIPHISTGQIFRDEIARGTELGKAAAELVNQGKLMPDSLTNELIQNRLEFADASNGFILDGYPRNVEQARFLDQHYPKVVAVLLDLPDQAVLERLMGRLSCKQCGAIYHEKFSPPRFFGVCDNCEGKLTKRLDDTEPIIRERLSIYHAQTSPVVEHYKQAGRLVVINAMPPIPEVTRLLMSALKMDKYEG